MQVYHHCKKCHLSLFGIPKPAAEKLLIDVNVSLEEIVRRIKIGAARESIKSGKLMVLRSSQELAS